MTQDDIFVWVIGAVVATLWLGSFLYRPVLCFVCSDAMSRIGPGRFYCTRCHREGKA